MSSNMSRDTGDYSRLCNLVEAALHIKLKTPADFDVLHNRIFERTHVMVSTPPACAPSTRWHSS